MEKTLVILAAGLGSRFGGLKQITPIGPSGEFIIDYSIYDAIKAGFTKVVFVIKEENLEDFDKTIGSRIKPFIKVEYAFQKMNFLPQDIDLTAREKPLGTGHALYCTKDTIKPTFLLISADDFYGSKSFQIASDFLDENEPKIGIIGYNLASTIPSENPVKRGIIFADDGEVTATIECVCTKKEDYVLCEELQGDKAYKRDFSSLTSMLMFAFNVDIFPRLEQDLNNFLERANLEKDEFILTSTIDEFIKEKAVKVISTPEKWMGMSYKEDAELVSNKIKEDIKRGIYKDNLWGE